MNLPFFFKNKNNQNSYYFGLFLKEEEGIAMVFLMENGSLRLVEKERFIYSNSWENIVQDIDELLFKIEQRLHISLDKTIFFVYSHFIDEKLNDIKKPYLQKIKEIVKNLELHALGYIECTEAALSYLEKKEEMPLTAILAELDKTNIGISIYKGGRKTFAKVLSRTDNLVDDFLTCFQELKGKALLPARIILYNSKNLDDESTKILTYRWTEDYFIQIPRVEILKEDEVIEALINVFQEQILKNVTKTELVPPEKEVMGFVIGQDIQTVEESRPTGKSTTNDYTNKNLHFSIPSLKNKMREIVTRLKFPVIGSSSKRNLPKKILAVIGLVIILLALVLNEIWLHKATLTVFLPAQTLQKQFTLNGALVDTGVGDLNIIVATSSANYSDSRAATGKRDIGENAKGSVTVSSFDDQGKLFAKGTTLTTGNLQFTLDGDVKVASSSLTPDGSAKLPGKNTVGVTAVNIGAESNVDKGQRFTIDGLSSATYFATNDSPFSGGSKKQVRTVSKQDMDALTASIEDKAKTQSQGQNSNVNTDEVVVPQLSKIELRDKKFSKEVGEEADQLNLQATVDYVNYYVKNSDLLNQIAQQLNPDVQSGFSLDPAKTHYSIDKVDQDAKSKATVLSITVNSKAVKQTSQKDILSDVQGRNKNMIDNILKKKYGADGYELTINDPIPFINTYLPFMQKNIHLIISSL